MIHRLFHISTELSTESAQSRSFVVYFASVAAATVLLLCGAPLTASAASCFSQPKSGSEVTLNAGAGLSSYDGTYAQLFTVSSDCYIDSATISIHYSAGSPLDGVLVDLWEVSGGVPDTHLETGSTIDTTSLSSSYSDETSTFAGTTLLQTGHTYAIAVSRGGHAGSFDNSNYIGWEAGTGSTLRTSRDDSATWGTGDQTPQEASLYIDGHGTGGGGGGIDCGSPIVTADLDWTPCITVNPSTGHIDFPASMIAVGLFQVFSWSNTDGTVGSTQCTSVTSSFASGMSACGGVGVHRYEVQTTNTGTYPTGSIGFFYVAVDDGGNYTAASPAFDTHTRIVTNIPSDGATVASSTPVTIGATVYINTNDYVDGLELIVKFAYMGDYQSLSGASPELFYMTYHFPITAAGSTTVSTTTSITRVGQYSLVTTLHNNGPIVRLSWANGLIITNRNILSNESHFTVDRYSGYDTFVASTTEAIQAFYASSSIAMSSCNTISEFSLTNCLSLLLLPQAEPIKVQLQNFRDGFLSVFPLGYVTRAVTIMATAPEKDLPDLFIPMPCFISISCGLSFDLTPWDKLTGDTSILGTATNPDTGDTLRDIVGTGWANFVYLVFFIGLISELLGLGRATIGTEMREQQHAEMARIHHRKHL